MPIAVLRDGDVASYVLVHATGFCKEVWVPVVELLDEAWLAVDQRGHGASGTSAPPFDWWDLGRDIVAVLGRTAGDAPVGVGHSSGGAALVMAELLRPGTFSSLVLVEPIITPPPHGRRDQYPLALAAEQRRQRFDSHRTALDSFRGRGPFARWVEAALEAYVLHGFHADGDGVTLACPAAVEAEYFRTAMTHGAFDRLGEIGCPVTLVVGADSDSPGMEHARAQQAALPRASIVEVPGATHFVPMERPDVVAEAAAAARRRGG